MESSDRLLATTLRVVLVGAFLWMIHDLLVPIALGALGAMLLFPLKNRLDRKLGKRARWTASLLTAGVVVGGVIPVGLVAAKVVSSVNDFLDRDWPATFETLRAFVWAKVESYGGKFQIEALNQESFGGTLQDLVSTVGTTLANAAQGIAVALPGQLLALFIFLLSLYYFLRDGNAVIKAILMLSPFTREATEELFESVHETVNGAIVGVSVTALVQGVLTMIALVVFIQNVVWQRAGIGAGCDSPRGHNAYHAWRGHLPDRRGSFGGCGGHGGGSGDHRCLGQRGATLGPEPGLQDAPVARAFEPFWGP